MAYILNEDFTGTAGTLPSSSTWTVYNQAGVPDFGPNDSEYYVTNTNIIYQDGNSNLIIKVGKVGTDGASGGTWPSGRCDTSGTAPGSGGQQGATAYMVQPGQSCEIRVRITPLEGCWPANWFLGLPAYNTASYAEIDMQESGDVPPGDNINTSNVTIWGGAVPDMMNASNNVGAFNIGDGLYHVWRLDLTNNLIKIYVDGNLLFSLTEAQAAVTAPSVTWPFNAAAGMYVILNVAVSTSQFGTPNAASLPAQIMAVDYVRMWAPAGPDPNTGSSRIAADLVPPKNQTVMQASRF